MTQQTLFDPHREELTQDFDGRTYTHELDHERLNTALGRVQKFLSDGQWRTLAEIAQAAGCSESGASARLRDLRKEKFGGYCVESERCGESALWKYRVRTS